MENVRARVLGRSVKRVKRGGEVLLSPRDAKILSRLGHVELLSGDRSTYAYATDRQSKGVQRAEIDATDAAVKLARELGVDIAKVKGTGADGRIIVSDVRDAADAQDE